MSKAESLKYYGNLSTETVEKMKVYRGCVYKLAKKIEELGESRELSLAFTHLEEALMYVNKHLCMVDPQAVKEDLCLEEPDVCQQKGCTGETLCCEETALDFMEGN